MNLLTVKNLSDYLNELINTLEKKIIKRTSKIGVKDLLYCLFIKIGQGLSFDYAVREINYSGLCNATKSAFVKKCQLFDYKYIEDLNSSLVDYFYSTLNKQNKCRLVAVDASILYTFEKFDQFKVSNNGKCRTILFSALYDIETKIPINYYIHKNRNEREALAEQFKCLKTDDIVVHDRGYYSEKVLSHYIDLNINAIFRLPVNNGFVNIIKKSKINDLVIDFTINKKDIKLRLLHYKINTNTGDQNYYFLTTVTNRYDIDFFKEAYRKRWNIETHFRDLKQNYSVANIKSKTLSGIYLEVAINHTLSFIASYVEFIATINNDLLASGNYKINTTTCKHFVTRKLIKLLLYGSEKTEKDVASIIDLISKSVVMVKKNRFYKRIRKRPRGKWTNSGTTSNRPHTTNNKKKVKDPDKT